METVTALISIHLLDSFQTATIDSDTKCENIMQIVIEQVSLL